MSESRFCLRFKQFEKAFLLLGEAVKIECPSVVERAGIIKAFEMAFELSWKMLKDYASHAYDEETAADVELRIREVYYPQMLDLYEKFKKIAGA